MATFACICDDTDPTCVAPNLTGTGGTITDCTDLCPLPVVTVQPSDVVADGTADPFTLTANATDYTTVQWQWWKLGDTQFSDISFGDPSNTPSYTSQAGFSGQLSGTRYRACFTNACGTTYSDEAVMTFADITCPNITTQPVDVTGAAGSDIAINWAAENDGQSGVSHEIQKSCDGGANWTAVQGGIGYGNNYVFEALAADDGCLMRVCFNGIPDCCTNEITITVEGVCEPVEVTGFIPGTGTVVACEGGSATITGLYSGTTPVAYTVQTRPAGQQTWINAGVSGQTTNGSVGYTINNIQGNDTGDQYRILMANDCTDPSVIAGPFTVQVLSGTFLCPPTTAALNSTLLVRYFPGLASGITDTQLFVSINGGTYTPAGPLLPWGGSGSTDQNVPLSQVLYDVGDVLCFRWQMHGPQGKICVDEVTCCTTIT